jgi:hypothetical protein
MAFPRAHDARQVDRELGDDTRQCRDGRIGRRRRGQQRRIPIGHPRPIRRLGRFGDDNELRPAGRPGDQLACDVEQRGDRDELVTGRETRDAISRPDCDAVTVGAVLEQWGGPSGWMPLTHAVQKWPCWTHDLTGRSIGSSSELGQLFPGGNAELAERVVDVGFHRVNG